MKNIILTLMVICILSIAGCCCAPKKTDGNSTSSSTQEVKTYKLNETFSMSDIKYTFTKSEKRAQVGTQYSNEKAADGAVFLIVYYTEENTGKETKTVTTDRFSLLDGKGRKFSTSSKASTSLMVEMKEKDFLLSQLQPNISHKSASVYEIPQDATGLKLEVNGGLFTTEKAFVNL